MMPLSLSHISIGVPNRTSCVDELQCEHARGAVATAYREQGVELHVDAEFAANATLHTLVAWSHFATADVFVMSPSSFSQVPALLNPRCVVFATRWRRRHGRFEQRYTLMNQISLVEWFHVGDV
jgi:aryl carrier-like protein